MKKCLQKFRFLTLLRISILIVLFNSQAFGQNLSCLSLQGDTLSIPVEEKAIVILLSDFRCSACDKFLSEYLAQLNPEIKIYAIARVGVSTLQRLAFKKDIEKKYEIPKDNICFDLQKKNEKKIVVKRYSDGLFRKLKIQNTPSILLLNKGKKSLIKYESLFEDVFISESAKIEIQSFFNMN